MKVASKKRVKKAGRTSPQITSSVEPSAITLNEDSGKEPEVDYSSESDPRYWRQKLLLRHYHFPASGASEYDLSALIEHAGVGYFFPLGTPDAEMAAGRASRIYQTVAEYGWDFAFRRFCRELIVSFEWNMNPVLWTYTTIHTLVGKRTSLERDSIPINTNRLRVLVVESDAGIRRALCWSVDQHAGFRSVPCDSAETFGRASSMRKPFLVLLNNNMAGPLGLKSGGPIASIHQGVPALTYSTHADGNQMLLFAPGGASGYFITRVAPERLLEPVLSLSRQPEMDAKDFLLCVKYHFQELLRLPSGLDNSELAKLTPREREVLKLLCKGLVDKEIAKEMGISAWTVHAHTKSIFERLKVHTRTEAVIRCLEK